MNQSGMDKADPPLLDSEHDSPTRRSKRFLGIDGHFDFVELSLEPLIVVAVVMQFTEHSHGFVAAVRLDQVAR